VSAPESEPQPPRLTRSLVAFLTLVFAVILIRTAWLCDDAAITLRTVLNVTHGFGLTYNIVERVQTFTHPLWLALLTVGYIVTGHIYVTTFGLSLVLSLYAFLERAHRLPLDDAGRVRGDRIAVLQCVHRLLDVGAREPPGMCAPRSIPEGIPERANGSTEGADVALDDHVMLVF
jgi:hypothetical protein